MTSVWDIPFSDYWNTQHLEINIVIILNLIGSLILGMALGYERIYQGRAAGMRTYSLVCLASCALTVFTGYAPNWFGNTNPHMIVDPTRVIQGIVSGIGFLCAGVIMKEGMTISGLSTAASIWLCSAIGVLVGVGFYASAIALTGLAILSMLLIAKFENNLPQKKVISVVIKFKPGFNPVEEKILNDVKKRGYQIAPNSLSIETDNTRQEWQCIAYALPNQKFSTLAEIANDLSNIESIESYKLTPVRN